MNIRLFWLSLFLPVVVWSKEESFFTAAVFEHRPRFHSEHEKYLYPKNVVLSNIHYFDKAAALAADKGADIIVFNEYGLFPYLQKRENFKLFAENIPDPRRHKFNPCVQNATDRFILHTFSCMARENNIYIVLNLADVHECDGFCELDNIGDCSAACPADGMLFYNTDVVFDNEGNIVARYHKVHPYFEVVNVPEEPEFVTFDTKFGKFGLIVCFDSVFEESFLLAKNYGIDTLIFPTFWFDDIVPFNAVEFQQSWALANGVNFLAANTQSPGYGSLGSGIYSKDKGALVYTYEPDGESKLLVANVGLNAPDNTQLLIVRNDDVITKHETGTQFPNNAFVSMVGKASDLFTEYRHFKSQTQNYKLVKLEQPEGKVDACYNDFCCELSFSAQNMEEDYYLAVFNGLNEVYNGLNGLRYYNWFEETCLLVRCDPVSSNPCVLQPPNSKTVFKKVEMRAKFSAASIYPTVSYENFRLAPKSEWSVIQKDSETVLRFQSNQNKPLLKVGLFGRVYDKDPPFVPFHKY